LSHAIHVTFVPQRYLRSTAAEFLEAHKAHATIPVDIERIVEFDLGLDIIPIPGLQRLCRTDAFISSDFGSISVDDELFEPRFQSRYRFSLAHEIAHLLLHRDIFVSRSIRSAEEYVAFFASMDPVEYDQLEWQANELAGLVLVPPSALAERFLKVKRWAEERGASLEKYGESALYVVANRLKDDFKVSRQVVEFRLQKDKLITLSGAPRMRREARH